MKTHHSLLPACLAVLAAVFAPAAVRAQTRVNVEFPELTAKAEETVDVTLDGPMLRLAGKFLNNSPEERAAKEVIGKLKGLYVRSYKFPKDGDYDRKVAERVRAQLGPTWNKVVKVTSKKSENVDIYVELRGEDVLGLLVMAAEPREFTLVNLVGPIDLDKLASLEGQLGIPRFSGPRSDKDKPAEEKKKPRAPEPPPKAKAEEP